MPITHAYVVEHTQTVLDWVRSTAGKNELKLAANEVEKFCTDNLAYIQLLSWTAENPFHSQQLASAKTNDPTYQGPAPEVKRAILRLRGLDLALAGRLVELLDTTDVQPMTLLQQKKLADIFKKQQSSIEALRWATVLRSTLLSPEMKKRADNTVTSKDSVTWLHEWAMQKNMLEQLTLPLDPQSNIEECVIKKSGAEAEMFLKQIQSALYQPAHLRHMIFSEAILSGYRGIMKLDLAQKEIWFLSWLIDLVAFGNKIGEYLTKPMMARVLAVYEGITQHTTAQQAFTAIEDKFSEVALDTIPATIDASLQLAAWNDGEQKLYARLIGQLKTTSPEQHIQLANAMLQAQKTNPNALKPWVNFYQRLADNPELPTPTFVPLLLEKMIKVDNNISLSRTITLSGIVMEFLLKSYHERYLDLLPKGSSSTALPGQQAQMQLDLIAKLGPLNVHPIAADTPLLQQIMSSQDNPFTPATSLTLEWPADGSSAPKAIYVPHPAQGLALEDSPHSTPVKCFT